MYHGTRAAEDLVRHVQADILDNVSLVVCTTSTLSRGEFSNVHFDAVFVDEAAQVRHCGRFGTPFVASRTLPPVWPSLVGWGLVCSGSAWLIAAFPSLQIPPSLTASV